MTKQADIGDTKVRLSLARARLYDALGYLQMVTQNVRFMDVLQGDVVTNLRDEYHKVNTLAQYVDQVIVELDKRTVKPKQKTKQRTKHT